MLVDIHNHVLPGLDDGPQTMENAILLVQNAVSNGITHIIATPHHQNKYMNNSATVKEAVSNLNREIATRNIPIEILQGQEIFFHNNLVESIGKEIITLANSKKYILIELPRDYFPTFTFEILLDIQLNGYTPIIAHPEKNSVLRRDKQLLHELVSKGNYIQITASSLIGIHGYALKKYTNDLVRHNLVHFISSDAHDYKKRTFMLPKAYQYIRKKFSEKHVTYFCENAKHVVFGTNFQPLPPIRFKKAVY